MINGYIVDEVCVCGKLRSEHQPQDTGVREMDGHGACPESFCGQFTWKKFVLFLPEHHGTDQLKQIVGAELLSERPNQRVIRCCKDEIALRESRETS